MRSKIPTLFMLFLVIISISCINPFSEILDASLTLTATAENEITDDDLTALAGRINESDIMELIDLNKTDKKTVAANVSFINWEEIKDFKQFIGTFILTDIFNEFFKTASLDMYIVPEFQDTTTCSEMGYFRIKDFNFIIKEKMFVNNIDTISLSITNDTLQYDQGKTLWTMDLNKTSSDKLSDFTARNTGKKAALAFNDRIFFIAIIAERIPTSLQLSPDMKPKECAYLSSMLKSNLTRDYKVENISLAEKTYKKFYIPSK